jgi:hypothetical protein
MDGSAENTGDLSSMDDLKNYAELVNAICISAMVDPRVVDDPQADDEIDIDTLEWADKVFLASIVGATTKQLELFRREQTGDVDTVDPANGHRPARSEIVKLRQWVTERTGFDGWWEALQLDRAV